MCGRFALTAPASTLIDVFEVDVLPDLVPAYNIAPTHRVLCVRSDGAARIAQRFRWGLIPRWAKDKAIGTRMLNARSETAATKPSFRAALRSRRLMVLADAFYEWKREGRTKIPHLIEVDGGRPFAMAGLWEAWRDPETGEDLHSCTILTTEPNPLMAEIHGRMPVILDPAHWDRWLDPRRTDPGELTDLFAPFAPERMRARRCAKAVGNVRNQGPEVQGPWIDEDSA